MEEAADLASEDSAEAGTLRRADLSDLEPVSFAAPVLRCRRRGRGSGIADDDIGPRSVSDHRNEPRVFRLALRRRTERPLR